VRALGHDLIVLAIRPLSGNPSSTRKEAHQCARWPSSVEYALTDLGTSLLVPLSARPVGLDHEAELATSPAGR
jgi:hypothetical protein